MCTLLSGSNYIFARSRAKLLRMFFVSDRFIRTSRRMSRFYKRTISEHVPSSLLVRQFVWSYETDEAAHFLIPLGGTEDEDVKVSVEKNKTVTIIAELDGVFEAMNGFKRYVCYIDLPDIDSPVKMYTTRGIKAIRFFNAGNVEIIIPKLKQHEKQDDENVNESTFNVNLDVISCEEDTYCDGDDDNINNSDSDSDEDDECDCDGRHNFSLTRFYARVRKILF